MNKKDIAVLAAKKGGITQTQMQQCFNLLIDTIKESLAEGKSITIMNFGTFSVEEKKEFSFTNPKTGVYTVLPKRKVVRFKSNNKFIKKR